MSSVFGALGLGGNNNKAQKAAIAEQQAQLVSDQGKSLQLLAGQAAKADNETAVLNQPQRGRKLLISADSNKSPSTLGG